MNFDQFLVLLRWRQRTLQIFSVPVFLLQNINEENLNLRRKRQELEDLLLQERALRAEAEKRLQDLLKDFEKFKADHDQVISKTATFLF